uniref:C-type lectin domain-containing protein n=1 Tax=Sinocyclocheilus rhinocerous TaxID=307959 RepID=A0A673KBE4_9TELE
MLVKGLTACLCSSGSDSVKIRNYRAAVVCLVLLCVLLLTAVVVLCVIFTQERQQQMSINENKKLTDELVVFTVGWIFYQSSFYYMSNETKNWTESRRYCTEKGADLIIINNREEYDFVQNMSAAAVVYIGLTDSDVEGSWKWVYVSYRTESSTEHLMLICTFSSWASGQPNGDNKVDEDCAVTVAVPRPVFLNLVGWHDVACNRAFQWICEKRISQFILP